MQIRPFYKIDPEEWLLVSNPDIAGAKRKAIENPALDERQIEVDCPLYLEHFWPMIWTAPCILSTSGL